METKSVSKKEEEKPVYTLPKFFIRSTKGTLSLMEEIEPFLTKVECRAKITELKALDFTYTMVYRLVKHEGRFFIYFKKNNK